MAISLGAVTRLNGSTLSRHRYGSCYLSGGLLEPITAVDIEHNDLLALARNDVAKEQFTLRTNGSALIDVRVAAIERLTTAINFGRVTIKGSRPGHCVIISERFTALDADRKLIPVKHEPCFALKSDHLVVSIDQAVAQQEAITGGKGSSLAVLSALSQFEGLDAPKFVVPNAIIVTTNAWQFLLAKLPKVREMVQEVERATW